jgi:hypothetical protein
MLGKSVLREFFLFLQKLHLQLRIRMPLHFDHQHHMNLLLEDIQPYQATYVTNTDLRNLRRM